MSKALIALETMRLVGAIAGLYLDGRENSGKEKSVNGKANNGPKGKEAKVANKPGSRLVSIPRKVRE